MMMFIIASIVIGVICLGAVFINKLMNYIEEHEDVIESDRWDR